MYYSLNFNWKIGPGDNYQAENIWILSSTYDQYLIAIYQFLGDCWNFSLYTKHQVSFISCISDVAIDSMSNNVVSLLVELS